MDAKSIVNTIATDVHKAALIAQSVLQGSVVQGAEKLFPEIEGEVAVLLKDAGIAAVVSGAVPYVEALIAFATALGAKPNQDLDNVGPGALNNWMEGGVGP